MCKKLSAYLTSPLLLINLLFILTSSFAVVIITTATRGRRLTINVDICPNELLSQSTSVDIFLLRINGH